MLNMDEQRDQVLASLQTMHERILQGYRDTTGASEEQAREVADLCLAGCKAAITAYFDTARLSSDPAIGLAYLVTVGGLLTQQFDHLTTVGLMVGKNVGADIGLLNNN